MFINAITMLCLNDPNHCLIMFIFLIEFDRLFYIIIDKKPKGGPLFDPTSYYFLESNAYGPITINNIHLG